ncbi:hypothetical protein HYV50_03615 [Candidatus Pacearchaeota archaeon]|nr:hypothetical protein [Candidatus Pacearchaeota archaeon]
MRKEIRFLLIVIVLIGLTGVLAYAAGSGGGGSSSSTNNDRNVGTASNDTNTTTNRTTGGRFVYQPRDCEALNTTRERIRCRLIQGEESLPDSVPEACRNETIRGRCVAFYNTIRTCYKLEGRAKDQCFKRASGLTRANLSVENPEGRPEKARNYMIALLYNLEEKVERQVNQSKLTADEGAEIVAKIIDIKKAILEGKRKPEIRTMVQELKQMWREKVKPTE